MCIFTKLGGKVERMVMERDKGEFEKEKEILKGK